MLIVGAGPTGLMLACQLARYNVKFRIIDTKPGPTKQSRAMGLHARSVEAYAQLSLEDFVKSRGRTVNGMKMYANGAHRMTLDLSSIGDGITPYSEMTVLEQSKNETMLYEKLLSSGGSVEWGVGFEDMEMKDGAAIVTLSNGSRLETEWVAACDGARSSVRHACGLEFVGGTYDATFYVADVDVEEGELSEEYSSIFLNDDGFCLTLKMSDLGKRYRLIGAVPSAAHNKPGWLESPDFEIAAEAFRQLTHKPLKLGTPDWFSTYSVHHRKLPSFRHGRVLFVGDAAHVHSPAGGQGMNTGLLDAHNLGWKLSLVTSGLASEKLIDSYNMEREPFATRLLATTDSAFRAIAGSNWYSRILRLHIVPLVLPTLMKFSTFRSFFFWSISQTGVTYNTSALSNGAHRAGDRFPMLDVRVNDGDKSICVFELFKNVGFYALDFTGSDTEWELSESVEKRCGVKLHYFKCDADEKELVRANVRNMLYIIRPDMYIGFSSVKVDLKEVTTYLTERVLS